MPSSEPMSPVTANVRKFAPQAKLPSPPLLQRMAHEEVKILRRLLADAAEYVPNPLLDRPEASQLLVRALHSWSTPASNEDSGVYSLSPVADEIRDMDRERFLFLRFNYCRKHVFDLLREWGPRRLTAEIIAELMRWEREVAEVRDELVRENMPLVLAMAKRTRITGIDLTDLISEGNLALLRAVNKFDCARGYKFSTYACRAILKSFSRVAARAGRHRGRFPTEYDPSLEKSDHQERSRAIAQRECVHELQTILDENIANLSDVEQKVILARFALDRPEPDASYKAKTLEEVGEMIGVTKERVRQIQNKALTKLRLALEQAVLSR